MANQGIIIRSLVSVFEKMSQKDAINNGAEKKTSTIAMVENANREFEKGSKIPVP